MGDYTVELKITTKYHDYMDYSQYFQFEKFHWKISPEQLWKLMLKWKLNWNNYGIIGTTVETMKQMENEVDLFSVLEKNYQFFNKKVLFQETVGGLTKKKMFSLWMVILLKYISSLNSLFSLKNFKMNLSPIFHKNQFISLCSKFIVEWIRPSIYINTVVWKKLCFSL